MKYNEIKFINLLLLEKPMISIRVVFFFFIRADEVMNMEVDLDTTVLPQPMEIFSKFKF